MWSPTPVDNSSSTEPSRGTSSRERNLPARDGCRTVASRCFRYRYSLFTEDVLNELAVVVNAHAVRHFCRRLNPNRTEESVANQLAFMDKLGFSRFVGLPQKQSRSLSLALVVKWQGWKIKKKLLRFQLCKNATEIGSHLPKVTKGRPWTRVVSWLHNYAHWEHLATPKWRHHPGNIAYSSDT